MVGARDGEEIEESGGRRRRGEEERDTAAEAEAGAGAGDPMAVLGPDIMWKVMGLLDAGSVARCIVVSQWWYEIAAADRVWAPKVFSPSILADPLFVEMPLRGLPLFPLFCLC